MYLPVRVSMRIFSPVLMNSGACTVMPVSSVMASARCSRNRAHAFGCFGHGQRDTGGNFHRHGLFLDERHGHFAVFHEIIFGVTDQFRRERHGFVAGRSVNT